MSCVAQSWSNDEGTAELQAVLSGDALAWQRFYRRYRPLITACVVQTLRSCRVPFARDDLEDYVSDVWLALLRRDAAGLRRFDPSRGRTLPSWIRLIASRATIDRLRARAERQRLRERAGEPEGSCCGDEHCRPDLALERCEEAGLARRALEQLRPRDRYFMELCLRGTATDEVARSLGIAASTVHSRRFKLGRKLHLMVRRQELRSRNGVRTFT